MKIKFNSDDDLPSKKTLKLCNMITVVGSVFHEGNKYYPQVSLEECWYNLKTSEYDGIGVYKGVDVNETNGLHDHIICHYWYFLEINFRFQPEVMTELMRWLP